MKTLMTIIPTLQGLITPVIDVAYRLQDEICDISLKKMPSSICGLWHTSVCVNAHTPQLHTDQDCTYTMMTVPQ